VAASARDSRLVALGGRLFRWRDYTPLPVLVLFWLLARSTLVTYLVGVALALAGELLRLWSLRHVGGESRTRGARPGGRLATSGPFAHVRNPLYLGNLAIVLGVGCMAGRPWFVAVAGALFLVQYVPIVRWEEARLREQFGAGYAAYCARVPRWVPTLRRGETGSFTPRRFQDVARTERRTLLALALVAGAFAARLLRYGA
jgi:protein-S-isoprenylcysteine O-methyltransferase Ste14